MTRAEAIAEIRQIDRRCRGPYQDQIEPAHVTRMSPDLLEAAAQIVNPRNGTVDLTKIPAKVLKSALLGNERTYPQARELDDIMRPGCGEDFNKVVCAGPLDGQVHEYECSWCHVKGVYRAPLYVLED